MRIYLNWIIFFHLFFSLNYVLAEAPKNFFKGSFYNSVQDNLLVATDKIMDSKFNKSVIVIVENSEEGAWGLAINKPMGTVDLGSLIYQFKKKEKIKKKLYKVKIPLFWGGPVDKSVLYILHSPEYKSRTTINFNEISISTDYETLIKIADKKGPKKSLVIFGYSGWYAGQLEGEMLKERWILSEMNTDLIFEMKNAKKWLNAMKNSFIHL